MNYLIDTNILIRLRDLGDIRHRDCINAVDMLFGRGETLCVCAQVLAEFWVVATRTANVNGLGLGYREALMELMEIRAVFPCLIEPADMADRWQKVVTKHRVLGKQAHDARLFAVMGAYDIQYILTYNTDNFTRYLEISPITPSTIVNTA